MQFTLIVCTYMRPQALLKLLQSVRNQTVYPNAILIIDGSSNEATAQILKEYSFENLSYYKVSDQDRGLTKQRNYGIERVEQQSDIVCFLDDDTVLETTYFEEILRTYQLFPNALGVGGYINNEVQWQKVSQTYVPNIKDYFYDGWKRLDGSRFVFRKKIGLDSDQPPGFLPEFSHGRSISFLPPSGKIYQVTQLMGGVSSFRKSVFEYQKFSTYFEGYGLYEDADFTLRLSKKGKLYVNTKAQLGHFHDQEGRPNQFYYGKMVVRNGWYVWKVAYPKASFVAVCKWHIISFLLTIVRFTNVITTSERKSAFTESVGRVAGWLSLFINSPKIQSE